VLVRRGVNSTMGTIVRMAAALAALVLLAVPAAPGVARAGVLTWQPSGAGAPAGSAAIPAARKAKNIVVITIDREIDAVMARSIGRRIQEAEDAGADGLVFELNTPGGELGAVREISAMIKRSKIPNTVAWVNPMAYSGGAVIALACREIVVSDEAAMGDAAIIAVSFGAMHERLGETERQKFLGPLLLEVVSSARLRGHDERLVQAFISRGVDLILIRNAQTGEQLFISKAEYREIFGEDPPEQTPTIPAASGGPTYESQTAPSLEQVGGEEGASGSGQPLLPGSEERFEPAIPNLPRG
jgi:membrane-bound ClpP family serine protease